MPVYNYSARDVQGLRLSGVLEADVIQEAVSILRQKDLVIISLREEKLKKAKEKKIRLEDLVVFSRQLATLIENGIPLVQSLAGLSQQQPNKTLALAVINIKRDIIEGSSLHAALARHPKIFSSLYISMVKAGEASGHLDEILDRLATYLEKTASLQRKIKAALVYPTVVISMAMLITLVILIKVVPTFESIFITLGGTLPLPTQILILVSTILRKFFVVFVAFCAGLVFLFKKYISTPKGKYQFDYQLLRLPIFGQLIQKIVIAKFTRTLSTLIKSALPILNALEIVATTSGNSIVERAIQNSRDAIRQGETIADPLSKSGVFPAMVIMMISVGEKTGQLPKMLSKISDLYEDEIEATLSGLTSMIEPLVIGLLGIIIGGIVISLFMPVFKVLELIH
ncbi:MAG: type II secretion system F family protein [Candidatus Omnitrophota bacterium]